MRQLLPFFTVALFVARAEASINFSPQTSEQTLDGIVFKQLIFHEQDKAIAYQQPRGWNYSGDATRIRFTPPDISQAQAEIEQSSLPAPQRFDEETMKALQQRVLTSVPNAQKMTFVSAEMNPIIINRNETYEVMVNYQLFGQEFATSVIFMDLPDTQVRFRVTARKQDFEKVHQAFRASLFSWQWN